jgi:ribokinase
MAAQGTGANDQPEVQRTVDKSDTADTADRGDTGDTGIHVSIDGVAPRIGSLAHVVVVGSINSDIVVRAPRHPMPGETLLGSGLATFAGGKGANQAVAAARAGAKVSLIGRIGPDAAGRELYGALAADGIDVTFVKTCKHDPTGTALIVVSDAGENTIVVVPGANGTLRDVHVGDATDAGMFSSAHVVLAQLEVPLPAVTRAFVDARNSGAITMLNLAPAPTAALPDELLAVTDVLIANETETELFDALHDPLLTNNIIRIRTEGVKGSTIGFPDGTTLHCEPFAVTMLDSTAAGDAFAGALAASIATGATYSVALTRGNAAGALACAVQGAQPSLPSNEAIDSLVATRP